MPTLSHHIDSSAVLRLLAAAGVGVTRQTLHSRAASGHFPAPAFSMGPRLTYWREADVLAFLGVQAPAPDSAPAPAPASSSPDAPIADAPAEGEAAGQEG